jgi:hypothetical protein
MHIVFVITWRRSADLLIATSIGGQMPQDRGCFRTRLSRATRSIAKSLSSCRRGVQVSTRSILELRHLNTTIITGCSDLPVLRKNSTSVPRMSDASETAAHTESKAAPPTPKITERQSNWLSGYIFVSTRALAALVTWTKLLRGGPSGRSCIDTCSGGCERFCERRFQRIRPSAAFESIFEPRIPSALRYRFTLHCAVSMFRFGQVTRATLGELDRIGIAVPHPLPSADASTLIVAALKLIYRHTIQFHSGHNTHQGRCSAPPSWVGADNSEHSSPLGLEISSSATHFEHDAITHGSFAAREANKQFVI